MVRYQPEHKRETRRQLIDSAVTAFRRDGVANAALKEIMQDLGMTVGGFYRHFPSKSALVQAAVAEGLSQSLDRMRQTPGENGLASIERFAGRYLSQAHRESLAEGCVLAALASDIARGDCEVKAACESGLRQVHTEMHERVPGDDQQLDEKLWGLIALEVGGLLLSRMVANDDTAAEILDSCRQSVKDLIGAQSPTSRSPDDDATTGRRPTAKTPPRRNSIS
jgi:TetR/AcrR family transcriptional repressor of nem operon